MSQSEPSLTAQSMFEVTVKVVVPEGELTDREDGITLKVGVTPGCVTVTTCGLTPVPEIVMFAEITVSSSNVTISGTGVSPQVVTVDDERLRRPHALEINP